MINQEVLGTVFFFSALAVVPFCGLTFFFLLWRKVGDPNATRKYLFGCGCIFVGVVIVAGRILTLSSLGR